MSLNQYYLDLAIGGGAPADNIFAIAKYQQANASPAFQDVVLAFTNLFAHNAAAPGTGPTGHFATSSTFDLRGGAGDPLWNLLGLVNSSSRLYNVRNLASANASANVWPTARTGASLYTSGLEVILGGGTVNPITADGEIAQYLKVVDVTPPPSSTPLAPAYQLGTQVTFTWTNPAGAHDNLLEWRISIGTSPGGSNVLNALSLPASATSYTLTTATPGVTYHASLTPISAAGVSATTAGSSDPVVLLDPATDHDGDGISNANEDTAGTRPLDASSRFAITSITRAGGQVTLSFPTVAGRHYHIESSTNLTTWTPEDEPQAQNQLGTGTPQTFTDPNPGPQRKFYQASVTRTPL